MEQNDQEKQSPSITNIPVKGDNLVLFTVIKDGQIAASRFVYLPHGEEYTEEIFNGALDRALEDIKEATITEFSPTYLEHLSRHSEDALTEGWNQK